jgi:hypothetical protein
VASAGPIGRLFGVRVAARLFVDGFSCDRQPFVSLEVPRGHQPFHSYSIHGCDRAI